MTMQIKCNCCQNVVEIPQWGPADSASGVEPTDPPADWRTIYTVIELHDVDGRTTTCPGEVSHSCPDCNQHMDPQDHLDAELVTRRFKMGDEQ